MSDGNLSTIRVTDIMSSPAITVNEDITIKDCINVLVNRKIAGAPVVDFAEKLVGIISERELLLQAASCNINDKINITRNPQSIPSNKNLKETLMTLIKNNRKWLPVVDKSNSVIGVISRRDLLKVILTHERL